MRRTMICTLVCAALVSITTHKAHAWSEATHAYIADHIGKSYGLRNLNEIYGSMAPDMHNYNFEIMNDQELMDCIRHHGHGFPPATADDFIVAWDLSSGWLERPAAYGYISHNDMWGADFVAHWTWFDGELGNGWVIEKSREMIDMVAVVEYAGGKNLWEFLGLDITNEVHHYAAELMCHVLIEKAGDILIKREDSAIGMKIALSTIFRTNSFNDIMVDVFDCADPSYVSQAELAFREQTFQYGLVFLQNEAAIKAGLNELQGGLGPSFFAAHQIILNEDQKQAVAGFAVEGLEMALMLAEPEFMGIINGIIANVEEIMADHGVSY